MANSVKFDSTEILNTTYLPRYVKHESAPLRELALMELAKEDGAVLVSEKYGIKYITIIGKLVAASRSALDTAIDSFKLLFSGKEKNLDISWEGGTRRYVATCARHAFDRDHYHNLFVPWSAEFVVATGIGKGTSLTAALNASAQNLSSELDTSVSLEGSAKPRPIFTITFNNANWPGGYVAKGIRLLNEDTDEKITCIRSAGFTNAKELIFDFENKKVTYDGIEEAFHGVLPVFKIGTNNFKLKAGGIIDQQFTGTVGSYADIYGANWLAQSFSVPVTDATYRGIDVYIKKTGTPSGVLTIRIETDSHGTPSGTLVDANATCSISGSSVATAAAWVKDTFNGNFTLTANTKYWIVFKSTASADAANCFQMAPSAPADSNYKRGNYAYTTDSGVSWTDAPTYDLRFKLRYGGVEDNAGAIILDIDYYKRYL